MFSFRSIAFLIHMGFIPTQCLRGSPQGGLGMQTLPEFPEEVRGLPGRRRGPYVRRHYRRRAFSGRRRSWFCLGLVLGVWALSLFFEPPQGLEVLFCVGLDLCGRRPNMCFFVFLRFLALACLTKVSLFLEPPKGVACFWFSFSPTPLLGHLQQKETCLIIRGPR